MFKDLNLFLSPEQWLSKSLKKKMQLVKNQLVAFYKCTQRTPIIELFLERP